MSWVTSILFLKKVHSINWLAQPILAQCSISIPPKTSENVFFSITLSTFVIFTPSIYLSKHSAVEAVEHCVKHAKVV